MKIQVLSPEIGYPNEQLSHDYWVRAATNKAIVELGHEALPPNSQEIPDIQLVFAGMEFHRPRYKVRFNGKFKAVWIYSRPEEMKQHVARLRQFHQIYSLTTRHREAFKEQTGLDTKLLRIATDKQYCPATKYAFDIAYMGTKVDYRLEAVMDLAQHGYRIVVAGYGWTSGVKHKNIHVAGQFWPNEDFGKFYNQAPLSIYPTREDFVNCGIVPIRVLDIYASSDCMCLCSPNPGLSETFTVIPPQYESLDRLNQIVDFFLKNPEERKHRQSAIREGVKRKYRDLVLDVVTDAMDFWSNK